MRALDRKLLRDIVRMKAQVAAIALVVASGVALFVATATAYRSLRTSERTYYTEQGFAHVWCQLARAPRAVARAIEALSGVSAVEGRLVTRGILDVDGLVEPASAVIVSIPSTSGHSVNDLHLRRGRHVEPGRSGEALVSEAFAAKNHVRPGDTLRAVIAGRRVELSVVGVALSPEYVMPTEPASLVPDDRRFAILWMAKGELEALLDMRGEFNDVVARLGPGADERFVIDGMDRVLAAYGGRGAFGRQSQGSHVMLEDHLVQLKSLTLIAPSIFLLVSAFLVHVVLARLIANQREQVGMLKSFGYSNAVLTTHYLELTLVIVVLGVATGFPIGIGLAHVIAEFYARFFRFPVLVFAIEPLVFVGAAVIAVLAAVAGALGALHRVAMLPPVVAMTPEVPAFRSTLLDRLGVAAKLSASSRMVVRNLTKRPLRSGLSSTAMALAVAVVILGRSSGDGLERMRDVQFQGAQREDASIVLARPRAIGTMSEFRGLPGVTRVEPYRLVPARVLLGGRYEDIVLYGLPEGGVLRRAVDSDYRRAPRLGSGVVLTSWTARELGLVPGDPVSIEIREGRRRVVTAPLAALIDEPLGEAGYMDLSALGRMLGEPETYSGVNLSIDPVRGRELYAVLKGMPQAVQISIRSGSLVSYREMSDTAVSFVRGIVVVFSVIIAFGVVYNCARIVVAERGRELATMRVLGFTRGEISRVLLGEVALLAIPAIPLGLAMGYLLAGGVAVTMSGSRMHVPLVVEPATYAFAVAVFAAAALASALVVRRRLDRLELVAVLKARE